MILFMESRILCVGILALGLAGCDGELSGEPLDGRVRDSHVDGGAADTAAGDRGVGDSTADSGPSPDSAVDGGPGADTTVDAGPSPDSTVDSGGSSDTTVDSGPSADSTVDSGASADSTVDGGASPDSSVDGAAAVCRTITTFADGKQPSQEIFVSATGSNQNGDGSRSLPYATIARAAQDALPGAAIRLLPGTYTGDEYVADLAGNANAPIWIGGEPGSARPVFDGGNQAIHLVRVRYVVVHDIEVRNTTQNGINCDDGADYGNVDATRYVIFRNLNIHDVGGTGNQDCLKLSGVDDYFVLDSQFARCGGGTSGSGIDHVGCHNGLVAHNSFDSMSGNAVQCKGGSTDIEVWANWMSNSGQRGVNMGGSTGFTFFRPPLSTTADNAEARRISVVSNVFVGGVTPFAFVGCVDCLAANNTVIDPENWLMRILQETVSDTTYTFLPASNGEVINNLFYFSRGQISTYINIGADTAPDTFTFTSNLWYAHDNASQSQPTLPVSETSGVVGQDPALGTSYTITSTSPAAGQGTTLQSVSTDYAGNCYAQPPSIGAYEAGL